jgi:predicted nucleic acid-binding protein
MILVDTSIWIEFFKGNIETKPLTKLIDNNTLCVNDLILLELLPSINHRKVEKLQELLCLIKNIPIEINWEKLISMQTLNLKNGVNNVGVPDLIISQNAIENNLELYTLDRHFELMSTLHGFELYR